MAAPNLDLLSRAVLRDYLGRSARGDYLPLVHYGDLVRQLLCLLEIVSRQEDADPLALEVPYHIPHGPPRLRVQTGGRLVQEDEVGLVHEGEGEPHLLLLASRELHEVHRRGVLQDHPPKYLVWVDGHVEETSVVFHGLSRRDVGQEGKALGDHPYSLVERLAFLPWVESQHADLASVPLSEAFEYLDGSRLPGPVGTEKREDLPLVDRERYRVDRLEAAIGLLQGGDFYDRQGRTCAARARL